MDHRRFDALARTVSHRSTRRAAFLGGLAAALTGLGARLAAQDATPPAASPLASPVASPVASPGPIDLLAGTPPAAANALARGSDCLAEGEFCDNQADCCSDRCGYFAPPPPGARTTCLARIGPSR